MSERERDRRMAEANRTKYIVEQQREKKSYHQKQEGVWTQHLAEPLSPLRGSEKEIGKISKNINDARKITTQKIVRPMNPQKRSTTARHWGLIILVLFITLIVIANIVQWLAGVLSR